MDLEEKSMSVFYVCRQYENVFSPFIGKGIELRFRFNSKKAANAFKLSCELGNNSYLQDKLIKETSFNTLDNNLQILDDVRCYCRHHYDNSCIDIWNPIIEQYEDFDYIYHIKLYLTRE